MVRLAIAFLLSAFSVAVYSGADDLVFTKRNAANNGQSMAVYPSPATDGFLTYKPLLKDVSWTTLGSNLGINSGVLSATFTQMPADWDAVSGSSLILNKPTLGSAAARDIPAIGDASGSQIVMGNDSRLTNARAPVAHLHGASDIASGVLDDARIPSLAISKTTGLQTALDSKTSIKRIRAQTNANGEYVWTFSPAYASGVVPVIGVTVEDGGTSFWNHHVKSVSNAGATIQITKTNAVTVLGISVLGISASPQAYIHLTASAP